MNTNELKERLKILAENNVISYRSSDLARQAFTQLQQVLHIEDIQASEMLFTHLPSAITRIERGEEIGAPMPEILAEIKTSKYYQDAMQQTKFIEKLHGYKLPQEEWDYLLIHYTNVFQQNEGGK
ncbi:PRD domain-containing protein [Mesobacillus subterraneus]|uniref:PRD domain-containing protein n=1 Tax=Mesobacillus subterraneus TaxID=285983 RepID=UPI001CFDE1E4|nr:PRD domain-containing protein [Mesobacillus subterraneus]WLR55383.1 PRD domain-containing protein [Mesobacillus subterraneus]